MPKKGYKTVTIKQETYDKMFSEYEVQKDELKFKGINTFSAYVVARFFRGYK